MLDNIYYPFHMKVNKRLLAFFGKEEVVVGEGIHQEVLCQDGSAGGVAEDVKVRFDVRIYIGIVGTEALVREMV